MNIFEIARSYQYPAFDTKPAEACLGVGAMFVLLFGLLVFSFFILWLITIIDIVKHDFKEGINKMVWFMFVLFIPPLGMILYYLIGREQRVDIGKISGSTKYRDVGRDRD